MVFPRIEGRSFLDFVSLFVSFFVWIAAMGVALLRLSTPGAVA